MWYRPTILLVMIACLCGCPEEEAEVPTVAGSYPLVVTPYDTDCPVDGTTVFADSFLTWMGGDGTWGTMEIVQDGGDLSVTLGECGFVGIIDEEGAYYFGGECTTTAEDATITVNCSGVAGPDVENPQVALVEGDMSIAVDYLDVNGNSVADGTVDCTREVTIVGLAQ